MSCGCDPFPCPPKINDINIDEWNRILWDFNKKLDQALKAVADLTQTTVPVNADWNATSGLAKILNKPSTFPPSSHTHPVATDTLPGFMPRINAAGDVSGNWPALSVEKIRGRAVSAASPADNTTLAWNAATQQYEPKVLNKALVGLSAVDNTSDMDKPVSTAVQQALTGKSNTGHTHASASISDFGSAVDARITAQKGQAGGLASLGTDGKLFQNQLPAIAIGETFTVSSQAAMLALTAQNNDVAIRLDLSNRRFLLSGGDSTVLGNWLEIGASGNVASVNGRTGVVVLNKADIGLPNTPNVDTSTTTNITEGTKKFFTDQRAKDAVNPMLQYVRIEDYGGVGDGTTDNVTAFNAAKAVAITKGLPLTFGLGTFWFGSTVYAETGMTIRGGSMYRTKLTFGSTFSGSAILETNGASHLIFEDFTITGTAKEMAAGLRINSYPNECYNILFSRIRVQDFYGYGIQLGGASSGDTRHFLSHVRFIDCIFERVGNPSNLYITNDSDPRYHAINLNQTTQNAVIDKCTFRNIGGNGVYAWQFAFDDQSLEDSTIRITNNYFYKCWMHVELTGLEAGKVPNRNGSMYGNTFAYPTSKDGYCVSVYGDTSYVNDNIFLTTERPAMEAGFSRGEVHSNIFVVGCAKGLATDGVFNGASEQVSAIELYNSGVTVKNNSFFFDPVKADGSLSPVLFRAVKLIGKVQNDPAIGFSDYMSYPVISGNLSYGGNGAFVSATNAPIRDVRIRENVIVTNKLSESPFLIQGWRWRIENNDIDLTGVPASGNIVSYSSLQSGHGVSGTFISGNTVIGNGAWLINPSSHHSIYLTKYLDQITNALTVKDISVSNDLTMNALLWSEDFTKTDPTAWEQAGITPTGNTIVSPSGKQNADTLTITAGGGNYKKQTFSVTSGEIRTFFFRARLPVSGAPSSLNYSIYDVTNGAEIVPPTNYVSQLTTTGWTKISRTYTVPAGCTQVAVYVSRDSAAGVFHVWGAQDNPGTEGPYLPTGATPAYFTQAGASNTQRINAGNISGTYTIDLSDFDDTYVFMVLDANVTLNVVGAAMGKTLYIRAAQGGSGGFTITFPAAFKFPSSIDWNTVAGKVNTFRSLCFSSSVIEATWTKYL